MRAARFPVLSGSDRLCVTGWVWREPSRNGSAGDSVSVVSKVGRSLSGVAEGVVIREFSRLFSAGGVFRAAGMNALSHSCPLVL